VPKRPVAPASAGDQWLGNTVDVVIEPTRLPATHTSEYSEKAELPPLATRQRSKLVAVSSPRQVPRAPSALDHDCDFAQAHCGIDASSVRMRGGSEAGRGRSREL